MSDLVLEWIMNNMNKPKRQLSPAINITTWNAEIVWQVTSCWIIFKSGSVRRILGKISTSRANHGTEKPGHGSLRAKHFQNGRIQDRALSYGLTGNVSGRQALTFPQILMPSPVLSGRREECPLVRSNFLILSEGLTFWLVPRSSR